MSFSEQGPIISRPEPYDINRPPEKHVQRRPGEWLDQSTQNLSAGFDTNGMAGKEKRYDDRLVDRDGEFESNFSAAAYLFPQNELYPPLEASPYQYRHQATEAYSRTAGDYRGVVDDLTIEIQGLKEELKWYKKESPDMLQKEKILEIECHSRLRGHKGELETILRGFIAGLDDPPDAVTSLQTTSTHCTNRCRLHFHSCPGFKNVSASPGSNPNTVGATSAILSETSYGWPSREPVPPRELSEEKAENLLHDVPEGLYPGHVVMTDKERKKIVVRRLEQLFTDKLSGRHTHRDRPNQQMTITAALAPLVSDARSQQRATVYQPSNPAMVESAREASFPPRYQQTSLPSGESQPRDNIPASNTNGDQPATRNHGKSIVASTSPSALRPTPPGQRPTRPMDLDPARAQIPSRNVEYIRHLGLTPPELLTESTRAAPDVHLNADRWVYLNLLYNLAQLHLINVTPHFVRTAVSEASTKFQLSPDGRKVRWRGDSGDSNSSNDSSGNGSQKSPDTNNNSTDGKRHKLSHSTRDEFGPGSFSTDPSKREPQVLFGASESFHYKPLFTQQEPPRERTLKDGMLSSLNPVRENLLSKTQLVPTASGMSNRRKRRRDGGIIYYSGTPFCIDLSGDPEDESDVSLVRSSEQMGHVPPMQLALPLPLSYLGNRPLSDMAHMVRSNTEANIGSDEDSLEPTTGSRDDSIELIPGFPWEDGVQAVEISPMESCGLGGTLPHDHFTVSVETKRTKQDSKLSLPSAQLANTGAETDGIHGPLASLLYPLRGDTQTVEIEYMTGSIKRLAPMPLPPAIFHLARSDTWSNIGYETGSEDYDM